MDIRRVTGTLIEFLFSHCADYKAMFVLLI